MFIEICIEMLKCSSPRRGGEHPPPPQDTGYRIQDNKLGLTASLLAGRAAKCLLPPRPPLKGWAVKVLGCPQAAGQPTKNRDLTSP